MIKKRLPKTTKNVNIQLLGRDLWSDLHHGLFNIVGGGLLV